MIPILCRAAQRLGVAVVLWCAPVLAARADPVTDWTRLGDALGRGGANWHSLAIMQMAMHDALNAALPVYARWAPAAPDEPPASGALPQAAMDAAARAVLLGLHPDLARVIDRAYTTAIDRLADGPARQAGVALGAAIGAAALRRRADDGWSHGYLFAVSSQPGAWRPTPPHQDNSGTTGARPFLRATRDDPAAVPPPALGGAEYLRDVAEVRRIGAAQTDARTRDGTEAAIFWATQSSQRGYLLLAASLLDRAPRPGGLWASARVMSQLAAALADSAITVWVEKERYLRWRPVTAITQGGFGVTADPGWQPLLDTPGHPEYPSGHASDCYVGAAVLAAVFGAGFGPIDYPSPGGPVSTADTAMGMGQHAQAGTPDGTTRRFATFAASAEECAQSRIWAGAHFRSADEEGRRIALALARLALAAVP